MPNDRRGPLAQLMSILGITLLVGVGSRNALAQSEQRVLKTADLVDLARYQGKWFEIGRLPLFWENKCAFEVTATYTLLANGKVDVLNSCREENGKLTSSHGTATRNSQDPSGARLKVSFFWPFSGDYWILQLDPLYQWVLVGAPSRKYLWILSRTPTLDAAIVTRLLKEAQDDGFDTARFQKTKQN